MGELDLSKAVEVGARVLTGQILVSDYDELRPQTQYAFKSDTESIITAALPHILDALADEAEDEGDAAYAAWQHAELGTGGPDHDAQKAAEDAYGAAAWLSAKVKEVRGA